MKIFCCAFAVLSLALVIIAEPTESGGDVGAEKIHKDANCPPCESTANCPGLVIRNFDICKRCSVCVMISYAGGRCQPPYAGATIICKPGLTCVNSVCVAPRK